MEVRGRNGKWFGTGDQRTVRKVGFDIVFELGPRICQGREGVNPFVVVNVIECHTHVCQHECIRSENGSRSRRGSVNG